MGSTGAGGQKFRRRRVDSDKLRATPDFAIPKLQRFEPGRCLSETGNFHLLEKTIPVIK